MNNSKPPAAEREKKFLTWWKEKRKHKTRFIIIGGLLWGLFTAVGVYLLINRFDFSRFDAIDFGIQTAVFIVGGLLLSYTFYQLQEKRFKQLTSQTD